MNRQSTNPSDAAKGQQDDLICTNCGGHCVFSPGLGKLVCTSCDSAFELTTPDDAQAQSEFPYVPGALESDPPMLSDERPHQCRNCGGEVMFVGAALSENCPYCDGPVVLSSVDAGYRTKALVPFGIDPKTARNRIRQWTSRRIGAPGNLQNILEDARLAGLYVPFWTFDSHEALQYWAKYTTGSGDDRRTHRTKGRFDIFFDDLLMPASPHVTPLIRDGILHGFDPGALRPYRAGYLAGSQQRDIIRAWHRAWPRTNPTRTF